MSELNMADGDSLNEVNSDREVDANAADADIDDDDVIAARYQLFGLPKNRPVLSARTTGDLCFGASKKFRNLWIIVVIIIVIIITIVNGYPHAGLTASRK